MNQYSTKANREKPKIMRKLVCRLKSYVASINHTNIFMKDFDK